MYVHREVEESKLRRVKFAFLVTTDRWDRRKPLRVYLERVIVERRATTRHRKWHQSEDWDVYRQRFDPPAIPTQEVVDSVMEEVRSRIEYVEPKKKLPQGEER